MVLLNHPTSPTYLIFPSSFNITKFQSKHLSVALLDCGSTADNPILKQVMNVYLDSVECSDDCCTVDELTGNTICEADCPLDYPNMNFDFDAMTWLNTPQICNTNKIFRVNMTVEYSKEPRYEIEY